jgi:hypothetical protein
MTEEHAEKTFSLEKFLEGVPPYQERQVEDLFSPRTNDLSTGEVNLSCGNQKCSDIRLFRRETSNVTTVGVADRGQFAFISYRCKNCAQQQKFFALLVKRIRAGTGEGTAMKLGEYPAFGPPTPSRLISLVGPDQELFLKGRRAENNGLGIGAFAYYRRIVKSQKDRIIAEIRRVAERTGATEQELALYDRAAKETQFTNAVRIIKDSVPRSLLIDGQENPLILLHDAISNGLHAQTDEENLESATHIRVVLADLVERVANALRDDSELKSSIAKLREKQRAAPRSSNRSEKSEAKEKPTAC